MRAASFGSGVPQSGHTPVISLFNDGRPGKRYKKAGVRDPSSYVSFSVRFRIR